MTNACVHLYDFSVLQIDPRFYASYVPTIIHCGRDPLLCCESFDDKESDRSTGAGLWEWHHQ